MRAVWIIIVTVLSACTAVPERNANSVDLAAGVSFDMGVAPPSLHQQQWQKKLTFSRAERSATLLSQLAVNQNGELRLVLTSGAGIPLLSMAFSDDEKISVSTQLATLPIDPEYILADVQLVHWPMKQLKGQLRGAQIQEFQRGATRVREIKRAHTLLLRIEYQGATTTLTNYMHQYQIIFTEVGV
ncbi:hypothetical protein CWC31_04750 [Pseudoalteromonas ruthenica]|uniref:DUF3261 domain-containing protein n=1 Tax=Pseudoalteromonas ruthenica TaxID=151081 RepID=UPI001108A8C0|nr:DUF3261 domain-containing protein [Pseudoalteromonas ruthenica]TLX51895.1 hypothetical protein CWC31_04750 [Pseudoalteromonas ruthenica]